jgi:hypothetical protein
LLLTSLNNPITTIINTKIKASIKKNQHGDFANEVKTFRKTLQKLKPFWGLANPKRHPL